MKNRKVLNYCGNGLLFLLVGITILVLCIFLVRVFSLGGKVLSWEFLFTAPRNCMQEGGIFPALVGTFWLTIISIGIVIPFGILTAIFLTNYGKPKWLLKVVQIAIDTLAGTPSIIFGLFGMAIFVNFFAMNVSLISGALTLAILALPLFINSYIEAIKSVPFDFYEASLALGATKRQTITKIVLPTAVPNILTGIIVCIGRVAGETAPIMFTAATFYTRHLPESLKDEVMALPYHIYALMTEGTHPETQVPIAYGTAVVLLLLVLGVSAAAVVIRSSIRRKRKW